MPLKPISVQPYLIEPSTTTSSTIYIDPYTSACEQFSALAVNLGWPADQRTVLESVMARESGCTPNAFNIKDPNGGSRGLMQINGFWTPWLTERGIITEAENLLHAETNLIAALAIYNYGVDKHGYGWGPWSATI
jgi:soluble lytic murein transglycosylase-like protein